MDLVLYNHYHNGDIFASKGYVADLIKEFKGSEITYQHNNSAKLLRDLNISFVSIEVPLGHLRDRVKYFVENNKLFVNTWIGNYLNPSVGINWSTYHLMFEEIYSFISNEIDKEIQLGPLEYYVPEINFDYFDIPDISVPEKSIIISNGPVMSGQSYLSDLNPLINQIVSGTDYNVFLTHFAPFNHDRIHYTNNLISTTGGDLNEISWIAGQCEYIIGRNSGPFCFMHTKKILNNRDKTLISIGNKEEDSFVYGMKFPAECLYFDDTEINKIIGVISA
jgi:hypothetical protein